MNPRFQKAGHWLRRRAENVAVALLSVMFATFIIQIFARYVLNRPVGWSEEVIITTWLWTVLWGAAFILRESEEIRFDIVYSLVSDAHTPRFHGFDWHRGCCPLRNLTACRVQLCRLHEGGALCLFPHTDQLALQRLHHLQYRVHLSLLLADLPGDPGREAAGERSSPASRMTMPPPFPICIVAIVLLGVLGLPIGHSMIAGSILYLLLSGLDLGTAAEQILNGLFNSYVLLAIPLFILAADLMNIGSLTDRLLQFCLVLVGRFRGGLGHVNVVANMIFAGMSGSAIADAVGIGRIIIGMMSRDGRYPVAYAGAITASAAIIGPIIPPSIPMVLYALISDTSIGYLFLGGFVPGIMLGITFMVANAIIARRRNYPVEPPIPVREIPRITLRAFPALMLPVILLFGIYGGVMTPTEGAAAAAFYALFASTVLYRAVTWRQLYDAMLTSGKATTSIGMLIAGALVFNYVVTVENIPASLARMLAGQDFSATMFLLVVNVILIVLGCLLEGSTILLVVVPIFIPTAKALGIDLVHFGVVVVVNIMIGLLTPPYGLLLFVLANMTKQPLGAIVREALPFIVMAIMVLAIITIVPDSILWLPRLWGYKG